ncbi:MAG: gamma-glutamylcyclotransferase [Pleurocapsa sp. MO_192.B19]|nr:gamma-glutamylcyclotransferase [Pleurocapsa sp. MO_192.B19]
MKSQPSTFNVFVYGTLKPGEANYQYYCGDRVTSQTPVYTFGNLYALPVGYPAMTEGENTVKGILLSFSDSSILKSLDKLEGYQEQRAFDLNEYYRQLVPIYNFAHQPRGKAWAYFMAIARVRQLQGTLITSGWWTTSL